MPNDPELPEIGPTERKFLSFFEFVVKAMAWLGIFVSPSLIGLIVGALIFLYAGRTTLGAVLWGGTLVLGMGIGAFWAERVRKTMGVVEFQTKLIASPELDHPEDEEK